MTATWSIVYNPWPHVEAKSHEITDISSHQRYQLADIFISLLFTGPFFLGFWRGFWQFSDHYLDLMGHDLSVWISIFGGGTILSALSFWQEQSERRNIQHSRERKWINLQAFTISRTAVDVVYWRGIWWVADDLFWGSKKAICIIIFLSHIILWKLKWQRCLMTTPLILANDFKRHRGEKQALTDCVNLDEKGILQRIYNHSVNCAIFELLQVLVWWGPWTLQDMYLKQLGRLNYLPSIIAGTMICFSLMILQNIAATVSEKISSPFTRHIMENIWFFLANIAVISYWRGGWGMWDEYFLNYKTAPWPILSNAFSAIIGYVMLAVTGQSSTFLAGLEDEDGTLENGKGVLFELNYTKTLVDFIRSKIDTKQLPPPVAV